MIEQGTAEWLEQRLGKATASRMADLTARTKSGWGASRTNYAAELVAERLTGQSAERFTNGAMQWGTDHEDDARAAYQIHALCAVEQCGFIDHPAIPMTGASPDGLIGADGLLELKCPNTATHVATLLGGEIPDKYVKQMLWQMACTGRQWCDFASYDPRLPETMRLWVRRVERDDDEIRRLEAYVIDFLGEVDETVAKLRGLYEIQQKEAA